MNSRTLVTVWITRVPQKQVEKIPQMSWGLASWRIFSNLIREKTLAHVQWFPITGFPPSDSNVFCTLHFMTDCLNFWFTFYYKKTILFVRSRTNHQWHFLVPVFFFSINFLSANVHRCYASSANETKTMVGGGAEKLDIYITTCVYNDTKCIYDCLTHSAWKNLWYNAKSFCACSSAAFSLV